MESDSSIPGRNYVRKLPANIPLLVTSAEHQDDVPAVYHVPCLRKLYTSLMTDNLCFFRSAAAKCIRTDLNKLPLAETKFLRISLSIMAFTFFTGVLGTGWEKFTIVFCIPPTPGKRFRQSFHERI